MELNFGDITIVNLALWTLLGIIIGTLLQLFDKRDVQSNAASAILLGIIGSILGGVVGHFIFGVGTNDFTFQSLLPAFVGAVLLVVVQRITARPEDHFKTSVNRLH